MSYRSKEPPSSGAPIRGIRGTKSPVGCEAPRREGASDWEPTPLNETDPSGVRTRFAGLKDQRLNCIEEWVMGSCADQLDPPGRSRTYTVF